MYKLAIVEDEENIRHSLECFIPWEKMGFQIVGTFSDGSDALEFLRENPCDAVMTDILMSRMSGLELIRSLYEIHPQIKVVILSGHSDFAYAQQAIQYKVVHYLVKPVDEDELIDVFKGIKEQLDNEKADPASADLEMKSLLQKTFFRDLLSGNVTTDNELSVYLKLLDLDRVSKSSPLFAFEIKNRKMSAEEPFTETVAPTVEDILKAQFSAEDDAFRSFVLEERNDVWRVIAIGLFSTDSEGAGNLCNEKKDILADRLNSVLPETYTSHLTHCVNRLKDLLAKSDSESFQDRQMDSALYQAVVSDYKLLMLELDLGDRDALDRILKGFILDLRQSSVEDVRFIFKNLYSVIELNYKKRKVNVWEITDGGFDPDHLCGADSIDSIETCILQDFGILCKSLKTKKHRTEHNTINRLVQYLNEHIEEDIGHEAMAHKYRMHPGYLSRLFKQEMGETLSDYMLRIKIEKAAALLKEGRYKVGEIAVMVGYNASSYFSIMFKKYTGYSPREYSQRAAP